MVVAPTYFTLRTKTDAFKKKLVLCNSHVQKGDIGRFPCLQDFVASASVDKIELFAITRRHLKKLAVSFGQYFPESADPHLGNFWNVNPFSEDVTSCNLNATEKELLIELSCDATSVSKHKSLLLPPFQIALENEYRDNSMTNQLNCC